MNKTIAKKPKQNHIFYGYSFAFLIVNFFIFRNRDYLIWIYIIPIIIYDIFQNLIYTKSLIIMRNHMILLYPDSYEEQVIHISEIISASNKVLTQNNKSIILDTKERVIQIDFVKNRKKYAK